MKHFRRTVLLFCAAFIALTLLSLCLGRYTVPLREVLRILASRFTPVAKTWEAGMEAAVLRIRPPRILLAALVGACLSLAGASYQGVFRNAMAAPDFLGASSGAAFGAALAILLGFSSAGITVSAFCFSLLTVALVFIVARRAPGKRAANLILAGIMISSLFSSGTSYIKLVADPSSKLPEITYWLMGSFSGKQWHDVRFALPFMLLGTVPLLLLRWRMNLLTMGDDEARAMGVDANRLRLLVVVCATLVTAASVSVSGVIGWVGLVIPHMARRVAGNDYRRLLPVTILLGAIFLLAVDDLCRNLLAVEIPIGILTSFIGAPFFLALMLKKEASL